MGARLPTGLRLGSLTAARVEVLLLALSLLATVVLSLLTLRQTTAHFRLERTAAFVARFNSPEVVALREHVDRWVETKSSPSDLYEDSMASTPQGSTMQAARLSKDEAMKLVADLRTLANFFQEFGTAMKHGSLDEEYACDLLGAVCVRYGRDLRPFIEETRKRRNRPQAYSEVFLLKDRMIRIDPSLAE